MSNPYGYTVPLALEDYVPVLLGGLGSWLLVESAATRLPEVRTIGRIGAVLVTAGGACKATWKLIVASSGQDVRVLENALFPLLSLGFCLVAWAVWSGYQGRKSAWWPVAALLSVAWIGAFAIGDLVPIFGVAVLASLTTTGLAIAWGVRTKDPAAIVLFAVQLAGVFGLVRLQGIEEQTLEIQWIEQSINTLAQGAFALGAWRVLRKVRASTEVMEGI
jgi:hypothetical protein